MKELEYILKISSQLERFKKVGDKYNFRCPICGDGHTNYKTRAWFIEGDKSYFFKCYNCGITTSFSNFLKEYFNDVYQEYIFTRLTKNFKYSENHFKPKKIDIVASKICKDLLRPVKEYDNAFAYIKSRKINERYYDNIFVIENFEKLKNIDKYKNYKILKNELRIVLPCYNSNGEIIGIIARDLKKKSDKRYLNLKFGEESLIYGLYDERGEYNINLNKTLYVCEGAFDSLMLDNCLAVNTSTLLKFEQALPKPLINSLNIVYISDNESRNQEILNVYDKIIKAGKKIVIFPEYVKGKDLNEMFINGYNLEELLEENTYKGVEAKIKFGKFKKL